jgi:prepilin-type N-terminal cleavage/methylation domain-containing protein
MRDRDSSAGFTLIETLVALVIFVAGYVLVHQSVSLGWRGAQVAHTERAAVRLARARLAAAGVEARLVEGPQSGQTSDGYTWTLHVNRYGQPGSDNPPARLGGFWVTVDVTWQEGVFRRTRSLRFTTLRLAALP